MEGLIFGILRYPGDVALLKNRHIKSITPCEGMRIPESGKFLFVESGTLGFGIRNTAAGIRNPTNDRIAIFH